MRKQLKSIDFLLILSVILLAVFGIIAIGSATHINVNDSFGEYNKQKIWLTMGIVLLGMVAAIDYRFICRFFIPIYVLCIFLLLATLITNFNTPGVARWLYIGPIGIQPSEFTKVFLIIYMASFIQIKKEKFNELPNLFLLIGTSSVPILLVVLQPSLSASLVLVAIAVSLLFMGNVKKKYVLVVLAIGIPLAIITYMDLHRLDPIFADIFLTNYQLERIHSALGINPSADAIYQQNQSILAIGSGQMSGKGLYQGVLTQTNSLPEAQNDLIFAVIGEEFGFIGCSIVLSLMLFVISRCIYTAYKASDLQGKLICIGVATMFTFQTFVNVSVATGLLPVTGMPFPFLSYGGSSMWVCMIAVGLVVNVGIRKTKSFFEG